MFPYHLVLPVISLAQTILNFGLITELNKCKFKTKDGNARNIAIGLVVMAMLLLTTSLIVPLTWYTSKGVSVTQGTDTYSKLCLGLIIGSAFITIVMTLAIRTSDELEEKNPSGCPEEAHVIAYLNIIGSFAGLVLFLGVIGLYYWYSRKDDRARKQQYIQQGMYKSKKEMIAELTEEATLRGLQERLAKPGLANPQ
jgi:hypothetical protein